MPVEFPDITDSFKRSVHTVVSSYFDGGTHRISDLDLLFPIAKLTFSVRDLESPTTLTIAFLSGPPFEQIDFHCHNPRGTNQQHGIETRASLVSSVIIANEKLLGDANKNEKSLDRSWNLLVALFTQWPLWAAHGIYQPELQLTPDDVALKPNLIEVAGILTCEIRSKYARYSNA